MADELTKRRGVAKASISRLKKVFLDKITSQTSITALKLRTDALEKYFAEFCELDSEIVLNGGKSEIDEVEEKYFILKEQLFSEVERRNPVHQDISQHLNQSFSRFADQQQTFFEQLHQSTAATEIRLPRINITPFSGNYSEFPSFKDLFVASIHNNISLSNAHKFQYLKGLLRGEALALLRHISITDANYEQAWEKLLQRFDKKGHVITSFIKTFLEQASFNQPNSKSLRQMSDVSDEVIRGLTALGTEANTRDPWLIHILLNKIDPESRNLWSQESVKLDNPNFNIFLKFLDNRANAMEACDMVTKRATRPTGTILKSHHASTEIVSTESDYKPVRSSCILCSQDHPLYRCDTFLKNDVPGRRALVESNNLCFNCLGISHQSRACRSRFCCQKCRRKHHTTLHTDQTETKSSNTATAGPSKNANDSNSVNSFSATTQQFNALLPTAIVHVRDNNQQLQSCRILLDSGSQGSFITESCLRRLQLPRQHARLLVNGLSSTTSTTKGKATINLISRFNSKQELRVNVLILRTISGKLPAIKTNITHCEYLKGMELADPDFGQSHELDILIGADHFFNILQEGRRTGPKGYPVAQNTIFGWILSGELSNNNQFSPDNILLTPYSFHVGINVDDTLRKFWEVEELPSKQSLTPEEEKCENHFKSNFSRDNQGKYIVRLPFSDNSTKLGNSLHAAISRLHSTERRLKSNTKLQHEYQNFMKEYLDLGHMEEVPFQFQSVPDESCFYLPHHAVVKECSTTTKVRVVFDGSAKTTNNISLNEKLLIGPTIQADLMSIIMRFRAHTIAFTADIEKMYRQVWISQKDYNFQRILWREATNLPIKHYNLKTVTYGTSSAPFLATRALHQLAEDGKEKYPLAAEKLLNSFYVDDLLSGADNLEDAILLKNQFDNLLKEGGFHLRKWASNSNELLNTMSNNSKQKNSINIVEKTDSIKLLGLQWNPLLDIFSFKVTLDDQPQATKRKLLSEASRIFDPLGWLAPFIIQFKILFQGLWLCGLNWDDPLPPEIKSKWFTLRNEFMQLEQIQIERQLPNQNQPIEYHGFCDASERAYAAVLYCRWETNGQYNTKIICSKTKVAPIKQISLPRLELCGAHLLSKMMKMIQKTLPYKNYKMFTWTDSTIVLAWLSDVPRRWKTYIGNRTSETLSNVPRECWNHVSTDENPADCASRGISASILKDFTLWWEGPNWLLKSQEHWPKTVSKNIINEDVLNEQRKINVLNSNIKLSIFNVLFHNISSFKKLLRVLSFIFRFIFNVRTIKITRKTGPITVHELETATNACIKWAQQEEFYVEINLLNKKHLLDRKSKLLSLSPFIDGNGILRVGGRLQNSDCNFNAKHPVILPKNHILSLMIVQYLHIKHHHVGTSLLLALVRQSYWIIDGRNVIRHFINKCITCVRQKAVVSNQLMGSLPAERVTPSRPFCRTGVDFAGPISIANKKGRGARAIKGYISVFICMTTKAVHLEVVSELTTAAFLATLKRFISRRGVPADMFSDNGKNFLGASKKL